ncbi:MAG: CerR family C-terminal domain-containing protein [Acidobacteriia bacterium]|nr:CerR family C-terminal domain-containing protein [Terriglobia bacterium]
MPVIQRQPSQAEHGAETRKRLLDTAECLFADRGFAATSVRDITAAADCNLAAVNYHFGGKQNLYREVFRRRLAALREQRIASIHAAREETGSLEAVLAAFAGTFLEPLVRRGRSRSVLDLLQREMLDPQLPPDMYRSEFVEPINGVLVSAMMSATPGLDVRSARVCAISVIGQLVQLARQVRRARLQPSAGDDVSALSETVAQIVRFSAAGVRACAKRAR